MSICIWWSKFRYPVGARFWEFPHGSWETRPDADLVEVAAGELAEETGLRAGAMTPLGVLFQAYGYSNQSVHVYLATDLSAGPRSLDHEEQGHRTGVFSIDEFTTMVTNGTIRDVTTIAAAYLFGLA